MHMYCSDLFILSMFKSAQKLILWKSFLNVLTSWIMYERRKKERKIKRKNELRERMNEDL